MGFLGNLKNYAKDAAAAKVDEAKSAAKAKAREAMESTSVGSAAMGFVDKVNASQQPQPTPMPQTAAQQPGQITVDGTSKQKMYVYLPSALPPVAQGQRLLMEVRPDGAPMVSETTGSSWSQDTHPDTYALFCDGRQVGMVGSMHGFYEHAFRVGLRVFVGTTCHGMYDSVTPDMYIDGWSYDEWKAFFTELGK